jgi:cytochrome c-type biogenesis protein CcmH
MIFWVIAAALTGLVAAALLPALAGWIRPRKSRQAAALAVYRAQLMDLTREEERGLLSEVEAAGLKAEIERRMLKIAGKPELEARSWQAGPAVLVTAVLVLPLAAIGLYLLLGQPGLRGHPHAELAANTAAPSDPQSTEIATLVAQLEQRMAEHPQDPVGWRLLGHAQGGLGRWPDSAASYARAVAAGAKDAATLAEWGEALVFAGGGTVSPPVEEVFRRALAADPKEPRARYYEGLAKLQRGDAKGAVALWRELVAQAPADAPWAAFIQDRIRLAEQMVEPSGPSEQDVAAASQMSPQEREAAIRGMVDRLASRLEREPGDLEGWLKLARAYDVLGEPARRRGALERAAALAPGRADLQLALAQAEAASGDRDKAAQRLTDVLGGLSKDAPERGAVEAELNRLRVQQ